MDTALLVVGGYLLGSMPWGYWLPLLVRHEDIRRQGSGNIGGTNVWRMYGWKLGLPVVALDTAKGFVPALVGVLFVSHLAAVLAGAAAMLGHWRPLFLRWQRGGKVVATCGGAFLGVAPLVGAVGACVWIVTFLLLRYASLASIVAALSLPVAAVLMGRPWPVIAFAAGAAAAVLVLHRANISRLRAGTENRFKFRRLRREPLA
ncbi:MAG: acyl phosphate:glycerol-3-phosphate acyltransferase [Gaiellaceae bacterium]|jgi:glycerol-3-phosphate acyltransferase PlsY|nr:acyl phosphate:glycerol-3-phosphate acyltransferase [Gaiellaceae bacterium]